MSAEDIASLRRKFESLLESARNLHKPTIVLWGPGTGDPAGFQKRLRIKENIRQECPKAFVFLPEEPEIRSVTGKFISDPDLQEVLQALVVDLVFALDTAPGVGQEVARYSAIESISKKLIVISLDSNRGGYPGIIRKKLNAVEFFSEEDLRVCDKASQYCREHIRAWLIKKVVGAGWQL